MRTGEKDGKERLASLQLRLLGPPQIIVEDKPLVGLTSAKAQGLLYYVSLTGHMHTRSALAALFWGELSNAAARSNLRKALQQLRHHLGAYLVIERDTVSLKKDADYWVDAVEFDTLLAEASVAEAPDRLERAIDLYRGDLLEGFYARNAPDFENWWLSEQARLREMMLESLNALADHHAGLGNLEAAIALTRRLLDLAPWREEAHRHLMTWLALSGQRGTALTQYEICRRVLAEELAVEPAGVTTALYESIRDGKLKPPSVSRTQPVKTKIPPPTFLAEREPTAESPKEPLVGRETQLARLMAFLGTASKGQGRVVFVRGEAGWGKTSLLDHFSRGAQDHQPDLIVASGTCTTYAGMGDPYLPFREILRALSGDVEQRWQAGAITRQHALQLWRFLPTALEALVLHGEHLIDALVPGEPLLQRAAAHESVAPELLGRLDHLLGSGRVRSKQVNVDQARVFEQYTDVLQALAREQPLLLVLDDLHWADASSISLLFHLGRKLVDSPILILGAYRPEEVLLGRESGEHPLVGPLHEFKRLFGDVWVDLGLDSRDEARRFVDALLDRDPNRLGESFRRQLARYTNGHPLFVLEILRDMKERGQLGRDEQGRWIESAEVTWDLPQRVEGIIEKRVSRLDPELQEALVAASVEGEGFTAEVVAQVCNGDERQMVEVFSGSLTKKHHLVEARGVQRVDGQRLSRYRFRHNLFQRYFYHTLDPVERAHLHEAVGTALEILYGGHSEETIVPLARHFEEAGRFRKAIEYLGQAGDSAIRVYANAEAIAHYSQAIKLALQVEVGSETLTSLYTRLGRALELDSQFDRVLATYEAMEELAQQLGDRHMELASLMARTTIQSVPTAVHAPERARVLGQRALTLADELGDQAAEAKILWSLSLANYFTNRLLPAIDCGERSLALARDLGLLEQTAQTLNDLGGFVYLYSGRIDQAKAALQEAGELWRSLDNTPMFADSLGGLCVAHVYAGDYDRAIALSEQAYQVSLDIENPWGQSYSRWAVGDTFVERGEYSRAIEVGEECIRLGEMAGFLAPMTHTRAVLATVYADLGVFERAMELVEVALRLGEKHNYRPDSLLILGVLAHLQVLTGDLAQAELTISQGKNDASRESWAVHYLTVLGADAELALRRQDYDHAMTVSDDLLALLRRYGMRSGLPKALYLQGQVLLGLGQEEAARVRFLDGRSEAERLQSRRILWRILHALAQVEDDLTEAASLHQRARETVRFISNHIDQADLRVSFLSQPDVRAVLEAVGPKAASI